MVVYGFAVYGEGKVLVWPAPMELANEEAKDDALQTPEDEFPENDVEKIQNAFPGLGSDVVKVALL
jgi:hypothetical protein